MKSIAERLTYANVVSTLALFLVLAGGAAIAAKVPKKSVGPSQLKAGAVTTAKIKANSVTTRKIKRNAVSNAKIKDSAIEGAKIQNGAIDGAKIADGSVTDDDINEASLPFARVVQRARGSSALAVTEEPRLYPLGNAAYTQGATESNLFLGALDVVFSSACASPRSVTAQVLLDPVDPLKPSSDEVVAQGVHDDPAGSGTLSRRVELGAMGGAVASRFEPGTAQNRRLSLVVSGKCGSGGGITANFGGVNVIATR
jgi:hypothetical protein